MQYRRLGNAGMKISAVSLGGWINYGENKIERDIAHKTVETAYEHGVNFFDLADIYGKGGAEEQMGAILKQYLRHTLVVSTKVFWPMSDDINDRGLSRKHIIESVDKSLHRLQTDYVDIYFCHRPDPETPIRETAQAMHTLIEQGKVLYWGTSEWSGAQIAEAYELCDRYGWHLPKVEQPQYSMFYRARVEQEILPATEPRGIGLVTWSPLAMGMLTGKYDDGIPSDSRFNREPWSQERYLNDANVRKVKQLKPIADELGIARSQLALAWILRKPGVSSVITGATRPAQVQENVKASEVELSAEVIARIDEILNS
ncbi:MAG: aldo/keto reductase family protein [Chloroflexales bacterium]|nr:aldo/keto reductase family protein [Chloroflexales bacterium]